MRRAVLFLLAFGIVTMADYSPCDLAQSLMGAQPAAAQDRPQGRPPEITAEQYNAALREQLKSGQITREQYLGAIENPPKPAPMTREQWERRGLQANAPSPPRERR